MKNSLPERAPKSQTGTEEIFEQVAYGLLSVPEAAKAMKLSIRQFYRRLAAWKRGKAADPPHGNKGRPPSNRLPDDIRLKIIELAVTKYQDFPPTLLTQHLVKNEGIKVSKETVRKILRELSPQASEQGLRRAGHFLRRRRSRFGELVQIDGSPHRWFGPGQKECSLIAFIDDATGRIAAAGFFPSETAAGYMTVLLQYIRAHGIPLALYSDRHGTFRALAQGRSKNVEGTQFQRVCDKLQIEQIFAQSPQAKGRIERLFKTLQGRWPHEFRVMGIEDMATANQRMDELIRDFNQRFGIDPREPLSANCAVAEESMPEIERICAWWHERVLSKSLSVSFGGSILQLKNASARKFELMGKKVSVIEYPDGRAPEMVYRDARGKEHLLCFEARKRKTLERTEYLESSKTIDACLDRIIEKEDLRPNGFVMKLECEMAEAKRRQAQRKERDQKARELEEKLKQRKNRSGK